MARFPIADKLCHWHLTWLLLSSWNMGFPDFQVLLFSTSLCPWLFDFVYHTQDPIRTPPFICRHFWCRSSPGLLNDSCVLIASPCVSACKVPCELQTHETCTACPPLPLLCSALEALQTYPASNTASPNYSVVIRAVSTLSSTGSRDPGVICGSY